MKSDVKISSNQVQITRVFNAPREKVFAAWSRQELLERWSGCNDSTRVEVKMDFRVGGSERTMRRMGPQTPFPGVALTNDSYYEDIVPNRRVVFAYTMSLGDRRVSASMATVEFVRTEKGTDLIFTDQGAYFEAGDGPKMREGGWSKLLEGLAKELARP